MLATPISADHDDQLAVAFSTACRLTGPFELSVTRRAGNRERIFVLRRPYAVIGRGAVADVRLDHPSVSRVHAFLQVIGGKVYCADLGSRTGVVWDGCPRAAGWLDDGRTVVIGGFNVSVVSPTADSQPELGSRHRWADGVAACPQATRLEVYRGSNGPVGSYPIDSLVSLVGRHPGCRLRFVEPTVDYFHGCVVNTPDGLWWIALSQRGVSLVNGHRTRFARLRDGDLLELGRVTLVPRTAGPASTPVDGALVPVAAPTAMTSATAEAVVPASAVLEMIAQFKDCIATMTRTFSTLQQEHAAAVGEYLRLVQEMTREMRQLRGEGDMEAPLPLLLAPPHTPQSAPSPRISGETDKPGLANAHAWFLDQLAKLGQAAQPTHGA